MKFPPAWARTDTWLLAGQGVVVAAGALGAALTPLIFDIPVLLLALNSGTGSLALTANVTDPAAFYLIGLARNAVIVPCAFILGRRHSAAVHERVSARALGRNRLLVYLSGILTVNSVTSAAAGALRAGFAGFLAVVVVATSLRMWSIRFVADRNAGRVKAVTDALERWDGPITAALLALVVLRVGVLVRRHARQS